MGLSLFNSHSVNILSFYYVPVSILGTVDTVLKTIVKNTYLLGAYILNVLYWGTQLFKGNHTYYAKTLKPPPISLPTHPSLFEKSCFKGSHCF